MTNSVDAPLTATIVITTKNRCDDLRKALQSCVSQLGEPEILVINDGSTDHTAAMVQSEFPAVRLVSHERSTGLVVARNRAAALASGDVIFSIDDDAAFTAPDIVSQVLREFQEPRVGAVAIPYVDVNRDGIEQQRTPDAASVFVTDRFIGTAHALRRDLFLQLGGYRELFFHQGEESDYCIRLLNAGYVVRLGNSPRIDHYESPRRDLRRMDIYGRRNDVLFAVLNVPWPWLPLQLLSATLKGLWCGFRIGRPVRMAQGLCFGYASAVRYCTQRAPVSVAAYRLFRRLRKARALTLDDALATLG